ncbi:MAG TPA: flavin reductase family protein [Bacillales bacterium]|nr:flavin reductase family protein [Bacillales bacterium]
MEQRQMLKKTEEVNLSILYYGTPVILLSTLNENGETNITPMSSSWALGDRIVLGLALSGKAVENLKRHPECVVNVPDPSLWQNVEALAPFTGKYPVPDQKKEQGFRYQKDKFTAAGLAIAQSKSVKPARISECPLQIEARVKHIRVPEEAPFFAIVEVQALHVHAHEEIMIDNRHVDPAKWSPLIYNFRHYFGLGGELGKTFRSET